MNHIVIIFLLVFVNYCFYSFICYVNDYLDLKNNINNNLGSRTPYRFVSNLSEESVNCNGCADAKIWAIIRHGTRFPSSDIIKAMNSTLQMLKSNILLQHSFDNGDLSKIQLDQLSNWYCNVEVEQAKQLTWEGQEEMVLLAKRMKKRFPNAIGHHYTSGSFLFGYTDTKRTQESAKYFTIGLFNTQLKNLSYAPTVEIDETFRFYKHCDKWQRQIKKNPETYKESDLFANSSEMLLAIKTVSSRLGFKRNLSLDEVDLMYKTCGYETSWHKHRSSPWCHAFDENDIQMFEYYDDLKLYWKDGYGYELNYKQACLAVKHLFDTVGREDSPKANFLFAHSGTILKILSHLQLYKPESHLRGDTLNKNRIWRASYIDAFASNVAFVLFKCKDNYYVLTLHQEKIVKLPMCDQELCPLEVLKEYFHDSIHNCDYERMCSLEKNQTANT